MLAHIIFANLTFFIELHANVFIAESKHTSIKT